MKASMGWVKTEDTDKPCKNCLGSEGIWTCAIAAMLKHMSQFDDGVIDITINKCTRGQNDKRGQV